MGLFKKANLPLAIACIMGATPSLAEETKPTEQENKSNLVIEQVVVTAQKREQNLQDTPIAISAFDRDALDDLKVRDISDLTSSVPNAQIAPSPGGSSGATITIRGAGMINPAITWEPAVGIYVDGVFVAKNLGGLFDLAEIERMEVLRGPQGTLYGKNTTGGAINVITRKPTQEAGAKVKFGAGNYGLFETGVSLDTGEVGVVSGMNIAAMRRSRDGFYDNEDSGAPFTAPIQVDEFNKQDSEAFRLAVGFDLSETVELSYVFDWSKQDNTPAYGQYEPGVPASTPSGFETAKTDRLEEGSLDGAVYERSRTDGHAVNITWDMTDNLTLKSITAKRGMKFDDSNDYDGTQFAGFNTERHVDFDQESQEFQLVGETDVMNFVAGIFYFDESADAINPFELGGALNVDNQYGVDATSYALYGQADFNVADVITLTVGARYTEEEKDAYVSHAGAALAGLGVDYQAEANETWDNFAPMFVASWFVADDLTLYGKVAKGWKAGGFNGEASDAVEAKTPYDEETLVAYEMGAKSQLWDNRIQANFAVFYNDIKDMQVSNYLGAYSIVENAGEATSSGFELEGLVLLTDELTASFSYGYLDTEFDEYILNGADIADDAVAPYSPENKLSLGLEYVKDVSFAELRARFDYSYTDSMYFYYDEPKATLTAAEDYSLINMRVALLGIDMGSDNTLDISVWGKNLTDEEYRLNGIPGFDGAAFTYGINYYGDPRTYGADVTLNF